MPFNAKKPEANAPGSCFLDFSNLVERYIALLTLLLTNSQFADHFTIAIHIVRPEVIEQPAPLSDYFQQAAAGRVIFFMRLEMLGQVGNALAQNRNLYFRGPRI